MQLGGLKAATKRTAFADVSNTVRQPATKDDMQVPGKKGGLEILKESAVSSVNDTVKPAALLRPAQKPLATVPLKSNTSNVVDKLSFAASKHPSVETSLAPTNTRKTLSKKATIVFQEPLSDPVPEISNSEAAKAAVPTRQPLEHQLEPKEPLAVTTQSAEKIDMPLTSASHVVIERYVEDAPTAATEATAKAAAEQLLEVNDAERIQTEIQDKYEYLDALEEQARVIEQERNEEIAKSQSLKRLEHEEYWDEEEDEEYFDADGYTTSRSFRSRGDTTNCLTVVLAPRVTTKSQRELEAAKLFVEANKTPEDIEDEQWDTSMVAEYGDEIFEYMHELEVSVVLFVVAPRKLISGRNA
jgi:G2/mitotic-specific cyclin 3/4